MNSDKTQKPKFKTVQKKLIATTKIVTNSKNTNFK